MGMVTSASFGVDLGILALIWLACWGVAFGLIRRGITYHHDPLIMSLTFLSFSAPLILLHWRQLAPLTDAVTAASLVTLVLAVALTLAIYTVIPKLLRRPDGLIARHPEEFYLRMDYRYLLPKCAEVLFQQLFIVILTTRLAATGMPVTGVVLAFLGILGVLHLPMLRVIGKRLGVWYGIASITLAAVFPLLILRVPSGVIYSYTAHWFFYTLAALFAWLSWRHTPEAGARTTDPLTER